MENDQNMQNKESLEKTASDGKTSNVGSGPANESAINNGGSGGATQPKERTGKDTSMGGATGSVGSSNGRCR